MSGDNGSDEKHKKVKDDDISPSKGAGLIREQIKLKMTTLSN